LRFPTAETGVGRDSVRMLSQCDGKPSISRCLDLPRLNLNAGDLRINEASVVNGLRRFEVFPNRSDD
jgi:hypothetical protein